MGLFDRLLGQRTRGAAAKGGSSTVEPASRKAAIKSTTVSVLAKPAADADLDSDDEGDLFGLPAPPIPTLCAPTLAPRRGAFDMKSGSIADGRTSGRSSSTSIQAPGTVPGGSQLEALYSDIVLIHRGRHAMVYRGRERRSRQRVVLKAYSQQQRNPVRAAALEREQEMLAAAAPHPGILGLERVLEDSEATYLVLEACGGGTLIEAIANSGGRLAERVAARLIAMPLLRALVYLHASGVVHRDLKPEHILLTQDGLRIADFSTAAWLPNAPLLLPLPIASAPATECRRSLELRSSIEKLHSRHGVSFTLYCSGGQQQHVEQTAQDHHQQQQQPHQQQQQQQQAKQRRQDVLNHRVGSIEYMAPEVLSKPTAAEVFHLVISHGMAEEDLPVYDEKADIWSVGVVLFEAVTGCQPFLADGAAEMAAVVAQRLATRDPDSGLPSFLARQPGLSADCKDFIARCLEDNPAARPSAADLLNHPWLARRASVAEDASMLLPGQAGSISRVQSSRGGRSASLDLQQGSPDAFAAAAASGMALRHSNTTSAVDLDLMRPTARSKTGRLDGGSRRAAAEAVVVRATRDM